MPWSGSAAVERWNRKLHFYLGLYFLFFLWLFALTGLLLNHSQWSFAEFWPMRKQSKFERPIARPAPGSDLAQAKELMRQLGLAGEIDWTARRADENRLDFRVGRPGRFWEIRADFERGQAAVQQTEVNGWGIVHVLHTFTGVRTGDTRNSRDWILTSLWAWSMDAFAVGLIAMVLGSYYMWWRLRHKRTAGAIALGLGVAVSGLFVVGLRWLF
jgi:hypothetical protein